MNLETLSPQQKGKNLGNVQEMNRSSVLRLLLKRSNCSRAEIAKELELKQATITNIIGDFLSWGLVEESGLISGSKGRRSISLRICQEKYFVIGVRLRRTSFKVGLFDFSGTNITTDQVTYDKKLGPENVIGLMRKSIREIIENNQDKCIIAIGIAVPGPYYADKGIISTITESPGWEGIEFKDKVTKDFEMPIIIEHDSNAGALAEWWLSQNDQLSGTLVYIGAGEGIGAGILHNGVLFRGKMGIAGEIGHTSINMHGPLCECGNRGCLTNYVSTSFMIKRVCEKRSEYPDTILKEDCTFYEIVDAIHQNDPLAIDVFNEVMQSFAVGIANVICTYDPNEIIISDRFSLIGDCIIEKLLETVTDKAKKNYFDHVTLKLGSFAKDASYIGAAAVAIDYCMENTNVFLKNLNNQTNTLSTEQY